MRSAQSESAPGEPAARLEAGALPVMPGFREMALRRADEQATQMAKARGRLVRELAAQRQAAGLSQTEIAARMGTSQSAVARLESGTADVRASTPGRSAAAVGGQIPGGLARSAEGAGACPTVRRPRPSRARLARGSPAGLAFR